MCIGRYKDYDEQLTAHKIEKYGKLNILAGRYEEYEQQLTSQNKEENTEN